MVKKYIGKCKLCGVKMYHDVDAPVSDESNVGDWDFYCLPYQLKGMDNGTWESLRLKYTGH